MTDIIAIVNQKGGVAKTTTTIHVGVALAHLGKQVLLVDLDSQGHLAEGFGIVADKIELEMSDVFEGSKSIKDIIMPNIRNLGLFTVNALIAATKVLIPMATHFWSMLGVARLLTSIQAVKQEANPTLELLGILPTRFTRTVHAREVIERTKEEVGQECHIFEHPIHESVRFAEATGQGTTVFDIAPEIEGARAYQAIAKEIMHG